MQAQVEDGVRSHGRNHGQRNSATPKRCHLLVSVRSGARDSMPGMMDTILNLGLNDDTVVAVARSDEERALRLGLLSPLSFRCTATLSWACKNGRTKITNRSRRVIQNLKHERYEDDVDDTKLSVADLKEFVKRFKDLVKDRTGKQFPNDPGEQLEGSIGAVFGSWMNDRAIVYRRKYNIPQEWGTAVNVQAMVFGNTGDTIRGSGVAFTRDPATRRKSFLRRIFDQRAGRRCRRGRAHAASRSPI